VPDLPILSPDELRTLAQKAAGSIHVSMGSDLLDSEVKIHIPTGWSLLDINMGGGLPVGKLVEIYGRESSAKSSLLYLSMASCQRMGGIPILLDTESAFSQDLAKIYGLDIDRVTCLPPELPLEEVFPTFLSLIRAFRGEYADRPIIIGWDTLAGTPTSDEVKKGEEEQRGMMPQYRAKIIRQGLRLVTYEIARSNVCLVLVNQAYEKMTPTGMPLLETPGGLATKYYTSVRILLKNIGLIKGSGEDAPPVGMNVVAKFEKNKLSPPRREVKSRFYYGVGFDDAFSLLDYSLDNGLSRKAGAWNKYTLSDGRELSFRDSGFRESLINNPELYEDMRRRALEHYRGSSLVIR
jgi:recombination protein RecA